MKGKQLFAATAALTVGLAGLTACGGGSDGGSGDSGGKVTLSVWHNATTGPGGDWWTKAGADFEAAHPNVKVELQVVQNEDYDGKLQTALNAGEAPDIFMQRGGGKMAAMAKAGQLMDLADSVTPETKSVINEAAFKPGTIDGKLYSMPLTVLPGGFFYSKDLFAKAGVTTPPATITELQAAVEKLKATKVAPIALGGKDAWPAAHYYYFFAVRECSAATITDTAKNLSFTDPCWVKAAERLKALADSKPFNEGFLTTSAQQGAGSSAGLVANHKAAMELMGAWDAGVIGSLTPDAKPLADLDWFPFPSVEGGAGDPGAMLGSVGGNSCWAKAPKAECTAFLNFLATTPLQEGYYRAFQAPPVNSKAQAVVTEPYLKSVIEAFNKAPFVSEWLDTVYGQNIGNALNTSVVDLLAGKTDAPGIVKAVQSAAKKA
ncbi:MAG: raffinose/stachyose/melibiose transport system substrate-binding protein [Actinomycetota bacterium]|nr:raffinose/stachyose/melibiose transport system substrate-binding protein [Actinomycetota bacterium]